MTTTASSSSQPAPLSLFSRLGANFGRKHSSHTGPSRHPRRYTDANDSEWYIPYNGPYEQPKEVAMGRVGDRDSWSELVAGGERTYDPFERDRSALGHGGASTSGHGHGYARGSSTQSHTFESHYGEEHERGRQFFPLAKFCESHAILGDGEHRSHAIASPTTSPISSRRGPQPTFLDMTGVGIGESPVPVQRVGHSSNSGHGHDPHEHSYAHASPSSAPQPAVSPRDSVASFWTFGRSASKRSPPINAGGGRPSVESRPSTSTRQTIAQAPVVMRDRSATVAGQSGEPSDARVLRPRANTAAPPAPSASSPALVTPLSQHQYTSDRPEPDCATSPYQRHPYATAIPPAGHRQHSRIMQPAQPKRDSRQRRAPTLNLNVPFLSSSKSVANLRKSTNNLKSSVSTPNLRGEGSCKMQGNSSSSAGSPGPASATSTGTKWLSAETWCDALLFPRPRFRLRSAHIISPPTSPVGCAPPYSAPAQTQSQPRSLKRSLLGGKSPSELRKDLQVPSSAPPVVLYSAPESVQPPPPPATIQAEVEPSQNLRRPPRPKSFAQDDLALPSPVPSLATVLKQNEEFDKERYEWKAKASGSLGNKRSRSLSRSRMKSKARLGGKAAESESELALSFDLIAAAAFHGHQTVKPSIHFAQTQTGSGSRSGVGTNSTSTGINTTSSHSRNTSNASRGGSGTSRSNGHGHARKESWGKSALKTAKNTANATGLCAFNEDLSPADEKILALDNTLQQDRTKYVHLDPREERKDTNESNIILISSQTTNYLVAPRQNAGGSSLSPVPSNQSGESTSHSGVGIALSTPTVLIDQAFQFTDHPYATGSRQQDDIPRAAEYAGPHPSRMADFVLNESSLNDVSARHRIPAVALRPYGESASLHPYAAVESRSRPSLRVPVRSIPPPAKMFADVGTGSIREVLPDDIQYSPYSAQHSESSRHNSDALGVEEALSLAFSHGGIDNGDAEVQMGDETSEGQDFGTRAVVQELIAPPLLRSGAHYRGSLMPQIDEVSGRESWQTSLDDDSNGNLVVPTPMSQSSYKLNTSPGQMSLDSSPMTSPRQFKKFDDMEDYSDLFYRPEPQATVADNSGGSGNDSGSSGRPTPPVDLARTLSSQEGSGGPERPLLSRSNSALTNLRRQLSEEYGAGIEDRHILDGDVGFGRHVSDVIEVDEDADEAHAIHAQGSSPPGATLPFRVQMTDPESSVPARLIPEDVESSRASSILERYETEEGTEIYYRLGEVPALATPDPITSSNIHRISAHGSYIDGTPQSNHRPLSPDDHGRIDRRSRPSLLPPMSATSTTRGSYMTSTSSASHISQLSDFPVPPERSSLTPGTIIQSYFGSTPKATERGDPLAGSESPERKRQQRESRRTTFGPVPVNSLNQT